MMDPSVIPILYDVLRTAAETDAVKTLFADCRRKLVDICVPQTPHASGLTVGFLSEEQMKETETAQVPVTRLTRPVDMVTNGLNLPVSYQQHQFRKISQEIKENVDLVKGQNEILFLSRSIDYFLDGHRYRTGIDRGISYALQYDVAAVKNHLEDNKKLRFPGYLLHQIICLADAIKELNIFYYSVLQDGHVADFNPETVKADLERRFGVHGGEAKRRKYIPHELVIKYQRGQMQEEPSMIDMVMSWNKEKNQKPSANMPGVPSVEAHDYLYILMEELAWNEELEEELLQRLDRVPGKRIVVDGGGQAE
jgi:hypothetical protein